MFPQDAMWGNIQTTVGAPQFPSRQTWCSAIELFVGVPAVLRRDQQENVCRSRAWQGYPFVAGQPTQGWDKATQPPMHLSSGQYKGEAIGDVTGHFVAHRTAP